MKDEETAEPPWGERGRENGRERGRGRGRDEEKDRKRICGDRESKLESVMEREREYEGGGKKEMAREIK